MDAQAVRSKHTPLHLLLLLLLLQQARSFLRS